MQVYRLSQLAVLRLFILKAGTGARTPDLLITNQLLYQLSYTGIYLEERLTSYREHEQTRKTTPTETNPI